MIDRFGPETNKTGGDWLIWTLNLQNDSLWTTSDPEIPANWQLPVYFLLFSLFSSEKLQSAVAADGKCKTYFYQSRIFGLGIFSQNRRNDF